MLHSNASKYKKKNLENKKRMFSRMFGEYGPSRTRLRIFLGMDYPITTQCRILMHLRNLAVENIVRRGKIACNKQFLLFSQCFLPYMAFILNSKCTLKCHLQFVSIWTNLKLCCLVMGYTIHIPLLSMHCSWEI